MRIRALFLLFAGASLAFAQVPVINSGGIGNLTTGQTPIAPGSLAVIFGTNLSSRIAEADTVPLSTNLGGVTVQFVNGSTTLNGAIKYVQPTDQAQGLISQVNVQVPWNLVPGGVATTVDVIVSHDGLSSAPAQVTVGPFSPGIFAAGGRGIVVNTDGTLAWPSGSVPGVITHPAKPGDLVIVYATGLGAVDSPIADGQSSSDKLRNALIKPVVMVGGISANVPFAGLTPQYPGVNQLNVIIPNATPGDSVPIQIQVGGITSPITTTMAVGP
jgi:uncharacterized protein (TIGR03437 family)